MKIEVEKENLEDITSYINSALEGVENGKEAGIDRQQIIGTLRDAEGWLFEITQESKISLDNEQHEQFEKSLLEPIAVFIQQRDELLKMLKKANGFAYEIYWQSDKFATEAGKIHEEIELTLRDIDGDTE